MTASGRGKATCSCFSECCMYLDKLNKRSMANKAHVGCTSKEKTERAARIPLARKKLWVNLFCPTYLVLVCVMHKKGCPIRLLPKIFHNLFTNVKSLGRELALQHCSVASRVDIKWGCFGQNPFLLPGATRSNFLGV